MYTRVTTGRFDAARVQEVQELVERTVVEAARAMPGFKSYNGGVDRQGNRLVAVTTWDTEAQARGFRDQLGNDILTQIQNAGVQLDDAQIFETVINV